MTFDPTTKDIVIRLLGELTAAIERRDGEGAIAVIDHIAIVAGRPFADLLIQELTLIALARVAIGTTDIGDTR